MPLLASAPLIESLAQLEVNDDVLVPPAKLKEPFDVTVIVLDSELVPLAELTWLFAPIVIDPDPL